MNSQLDTVECLYVRYKNSIVTEYCEKKEFVSNDKKTENTSADIAFEMMLFLQY